MLAFTPRGRRRLASPQRTTILALILLVEAVVIASGCAAANSMTAAPTGSSIVVSPGKLVLEAGSEYSFSATRASNSGSMLIWSATSGFIGVDGHFIAPQVKSPTVVIVKAQSSSSPSQYGSAAVTVVAKQQTPPTITNTNLPGATQGSSYQFALSATGGTPPYVWSVASGSLPQGFQLSSTGSIAGTATTGGSFSFMVGLQDANKQTAFRQLSLAVTGGGGTPSISDTSLPGATQGTSYQFTLSGTGGTPPYAWAVTAGSLPQGFQLGSTGLLKGTATTSGAFHFTLSLQDANKQAASRQFALTVSPDTQQGTFDGPAELPRVYVSTAMADTPANGATHLVAAGGDFQAALNSANCGDTIELQAGATFTGAFSIPAKACDDSHWIIIRTSSPDSALPAEGTRMVPCYAGVASLPGRPSFSCPAVRNVLAKIAADSVGSGPIILADGANHYRFLGLEITRSAGHAVVYNLVSHAQNGRADHIIFDRSWLHGSAQDETTRGIMLPGGSTYIGIVDSYMNDFHCVAVSGACGDSQAIGGGVGDLPMGPFRIVNNFLEAATETILFGGGPATVAPADIEIRHNHMFKPLSWMAVGKGRPAVGGRDGHPFIVKNLFELKNGQRILLDGNLLENTWGGFTQTGFGILLTPKNQAGAGRNLCPDCVVTDVTIRNTVIRHVASGIVIGNGVSSTGGVATDGERYSIHDVVIDGIDGPTYGGLGLGAQVSMSPNAPLLQHVHIDHVTMFPTHSLFAFGDDTTINPRMNDFLFTNSIVNAGMYPVISTSGKTDCAHQGKPILALGNCFSNYQFTSNAIVGALGRPSSSSGDWPVGNLFPSTDADVNFVNYKNGNGGDYHLLPSSPYKNAGLDGKDLGADMDAVTNALAGVE
jgi:hypothetical protein